MKQGLLNMWKIQTHIRVFIKFSQLIWRIPVIGRYLSMILDRLILIAYGIDLDSKSIQIKSLSIAHPSGVLLGGNGIVSNGRVAIMAGVMFVGKSPEDADYIERHKNGTVFCLGDNVVIGAGSTVIGPVSICDNVVIGAMSLVNKNIREPGVYAGIPVKKLSDKVTSAWVEN